MVDDIIDTAGTVVAGAELLLKRGALSVKVLATHGILSGPAIERLKTAPLSEIVITNSFPTSNEALSLPNLTVLSIAPILGWNHRSDIQRQLGERNIQGREHLRLSSVTS